ncbi:MAG: hypothetical protein K2X87_17400 [Gemmataceae bacterium]|nr:hypothetical protein [Gemmataceae bacterium]
MGLALNTNVASLTAQNNITATNTNLSKSLERLSTGLKVNRGADGPAALVISEQQRAQISGLRTAIDNTNKGVSMVQTAEGALNEINRLLGKVRGLALDSANSGVNDSSALAANQAEIDNALATISSIANTTKFGASKFLLNGQAGILATVNGANTSSLGQIKAGTAAAVGSQAVVVGAAGGATVQGGSAVNTGTAPTGAVLTGAANLNEAGGAPGAGSSLTISGGGLASAVVVDLSATATAAAAVTAVQNALNTAQPGKFTVGGSNGAALTITALDSNAAVTAVSSNAATATFTGITNTAGGQTSAAGTATLTISGGGLAAPMVLDVSAVTAANYVSTVQAALDTAAGAGNFTAALDGSNKFTITSRIGASAMTVASGNATTATFFGIASGAGVTGTAAAAVDSTTASAGNATGGRAVGGAIMSTGGLTANGKLTVTGGSLTANLTVDLAIGDSATTIVAKTQAALDAAGSIGGGAGKFTVTGSAGGNLVIQSNVLGSAAITVKADSATTTAVTGVSNAAADTGPAGNALRVFVGSNEATVSTGSQGLGNAVTFGGANGLSFNVGVAGGKATSGSTLLDVADNSLTFQIGANANETAEISIDKVTADRLGTGVSGLSNLATTDLSKIKVTTTADAQDAISVVDQAIADVSTLRGKLGAFQANTLESNATNLRATLENTTSAESVIRDTDFANEIAMFTKLQTQMQAGATVLGNANQLTTLVAGLLRS